MKYFATAVQGLGQILEQEIRARLKTSVVDAPEFDGRGDVIGFEPERLDKDLLRTCEDLYVEVGRSSAKTPKGLIGVFQRDALERALSVFAMRVKPLKSRMSYRVIARVLTERNFLRSELRDEANEQIAKLRPKWRAGDPADLEFWILETKRNAFRLGLRLTGPEMRHRTGRSVERPGSLKPTVAAAMVFLAGEPGNLPMLDPACGAGTILSEALGVEWTAAGSDLDTSAAEASRANVPLASIFRADARRLPFRDGVFGAVVSNLPFGKQYRVSGPVTEWLTEVLQECRRVSRPKSRIVLLVPGSRPFSQALQQVGLEVVRRYNLRVRGQPTALWEIRA